MKRMIFFALIMIILSSTASASALPMNQVTVNAPWTFDIIDPAEDGLEYFSSAFVGKGQIPMLSYSKGSRIYMAFKATTAVPGNCGHGNRWYCTYWQDSDGIDFVSQMATFQEGETHWVSWAYWAGDYIRTISYHYTNDMTFLGYDIRDFIQYDKFTLQPGGHLTGSPSLLHNQAGHYEMAFTTRFNLMFAFLIYVHYTGQMNTSCVDSGSRYTCDIIEYSSITKESPSIQVDPYGNVGIAYRKNVSELWYAYPHTPTAQVGSNCGPGENTWRCVGIIENPTYPIGPVVDLAFGRTALEKGIAFTWMNQFGEYRILNHAEYVGGGGNCGWDANAFGDYDYRWMCDTVTSLDYLPEGDPFSFSIDKDPEGYSVIAFDFAAYDGDNNGLYIAYPNARAGIAEPGWTIQQIDRSGTPGIDSGAQAAISISNEGRGLIFYQQSFSSNPADKKIALQNFQSFLPLAARH
jgi:hypothetical protein